VAKRATICGHPADQVVKRGQCVWLRAGFDDIWCLKHRQLAPELRALIALEPCVLGLDLASQSQALLELPDQALAWITQAPPETRRQAAQLLPADQLQWATSDPDGRTRLFAAAKLPPDQLAWTGNDPNGLVRLVAAMRKELGPERAHAFAVAAERFV